MNINRIRAAATAAFVLATAAPAFAMPPLTYGFRSGAAASTIEGERVLGVGSDTRVGFAGGFFARHRLGSWLSVQGEVGWVSKGSQSDVSITYMPPTGPPSYETMNIHFDTRIDYVEIPLLLRMDVPTGGFLEPYFLAGPGVAFRTGSGRSSDYTITSVPAAAPAPSRVRNAAIFEEVGTFDESNFRNVDWSVTGGAGLMLGRGPIRFVIDSRYTLGLVGIHPSVEASASHNASWATTVGIELR